MPIVTVTENNATTYHAVTEADEIRLSAVVDEYGLDACRTREGAEHELRTEYLRRLTEHAHDCAMLQVLAERNEPECIEDKLPIDFLRSFSRLAAKVATDAIWFRTYEPFNALTAEVVKRGEHGTAMLIDDEQVGSIDDDSWDASSRALNHQSPFWKARRAEEAAREAKTAALGDAFRTVVQTGLSALNALDKRKAKRKTIANKTVRRSKRKASK